MTKLALPGQHHGDAMLVGGGDHFGVAYGTARLNDGAYSGLSCLIHSVAEWEERIGAENGARRVVTR